MTLSVVALARNYHMLPSEVIASANTYDLMADDIYTTWLEHEQNKGQPGYTAPEPDQATLEEIMRAVKGK
jgi:hypothetical protein